MSKALNIILPTIRFLPVTRDIVNHLIGVVGGAEDSHLTIADGQEDDQKRETILAKAARLAKDGKFTYIGLKDATQRIFLATELETEWILQLSDDDPFSVNLISGASSMSRTVSSDTMAISPYAYLSYSPTQLNLFRLQDIEEEEQEARLLSLYKQPHLTALLWYSTIRRKPFLEWMEFLRTKTIMPTYSDQLLISYLAMKGKIVASKEKYFFAKDDRDWHDPRLAIIKDSGSYPNKFLTLFHEIFWISDLFTFLRSHGLEDAAVPSLTFRAAALLAAGVSVFENRLRVLEIEKSRDSENAYSLIVNLAAHANSLSKAPLDEHVRFFMQVQSVAASCRLKTEASRGLSPHPRCQESELTGQSTEATSPVVSVVIPCYNQAQYLPEAVESVVHQTFTDWECIIVNDGSPDQTSQVARDLIARYPGKRIYLLEKKNGGLADARNAGIAASHGRYLLPLDADDVLKPYALARLVEVLETQSDVAIVYPDYETFGTQSHVVRCIDEHLFLDAARLKNGLPSCSGLPYCSLYRRDVWSKVGGYNPNMIWGYEDWDFWIGCLEKGFRARRVPEPLFLYRMKSGSMYSNALKHDAELKARIILNHSALFDEAVRQRAEAVLQAPITSELSVGERPPQAMPASTHSTAAPSPPEASDSKWPPEVTTHVRQADAHFLEGDLPAARDSLRKALVVVPRDPQLIIAYGNVVLRLGDVEGARREFVKTTTLHPACGPAHLNLAAVLVMLERRDEAECSVRQALTLNPNDVDALKLLGRICLESGRHVEGVQTYTDALRQSPDDVETLLALGKCAVEASDLAGAQTLYERALKLVPDNDLARENLEIVKERMKADVGVAHAPVGASIIHSSETTHAKEGRQSKASETKPSVHHSSVLAMSGSTLRAPMVSVIVPTYNRPDTLLDALRSILNQTYQDFEIIVVNDAGSDVENIVRFLDKDDRITYIRHGSNRNLAAARNTGIMVARGKYIAYLDDDDLYRPDHLQTLVTFLEQSKCKVAYTDAYRAHQERRDGRYVVTKRDIPYSFDFDHDRILVHNFVPVLCFMHERACLNAVGFFDESLTTHEDWELWIRLSRRFQFAHIKKVTCEFASRIDGSTMSSSKFADFRRTYAIILERYKVSAAEKQHVRAAQDRLLQSMREQTASTDVATQPAWPAEVIEQVRQAEQHLVQGDPPAAAQALSQALQLVPHDPELIVAHGNILLRADDIEGARREFVKATVLRPDYAPAHADLAVVLLHLDRSAEAEVSARRVLELDSTNISGLKILAKVCLNTERYQEAVQAYVTILQHAPNDIETLILVGNCYAEIGRSEDAKSFYHRALQLDPGNTAAAESLGLVNGKELASGLAISTDGKASEREPMPVSIIIPVFNRLDLTRQCLESIRRTSPVGRYEIVVVDNGSTDGTSDFLRQQQQAGHLRVVWNNENIGFAKACNQGARAAKSDYLLFLNNDTVSQTGWLEPLCEVLDRDHSVAAVGSKLLFPDGALQHAGVIVVLDERHPSSIMVPNHIDYKQPDHLEANRMRTFQSLTAACLLVRRAAFEQAGGFDEGYWNGYEDVDLCFTLQAQGWKLVYRPESVLIHHESQGGPERFVKEGENLIRLNQRWLAKCEPDFIIKSDGSIIQADAGRIQMYKLPTEVSPNCLPSPIDGPTGTNISGGADQKEEAARPVASIIIVTYNSASTIRNCLESIFSCASARIEVIVADNASTDDTRAILAAHKERITILEHSDNLGFSLACNQGIRASSGEYIVLLNPDTVVTQGWLERMKTHFGQDVGAVGPVSDFAAGLQNIDRHLPDGAPSRMGLLEVADLLARVNHGKGLDARLLTGFCMMIPRKVLDEIGLLDETLFLGNDDLDLSWRLREKGYRLVVATDAFVHHKGQVSFKSAPSEQTSRLVQESTDRLYAKLEAHYGNGSVPPPMELWGIDWFRPSHAHFRPQASSPVQGLTSIIILAFNGLEHTIDCLKSLNAYTPETHEIIVVDNGSTDGTVDYLRRYSVKHENIRVIANSSNKGFAAGNNQGLSIARGEYLVLLNNDTMVTSGWLKGMFKLFKQHPDVGIVGPMSNYAMEPQLVPDAKYQSIPQMEAFAAKWSADHAGQSLPVKRVVGFCLMTTRRVTDLIGGLDERFGSGNFEDDDLCCRAALAGFQARIARDVFIHHTGSQTFKIAGIDYSQSLDRNWELFKAKWGIAADVPYEKGYRFPSQIPQGSDLSIPLPDVDADHRREDQGRWWQEFSERPGRSQPAVTEEAPLRVVIVPNGHGLAPLWPSLVQHTKHPLAITILPSYGNGNGADSAHEVTCPDGWQISTSDLSAIRLFNQLLQSAHDDPVILLSSDLILTPGWLKRLLAALKRDQCRAAVGPTSNGGAAPQQIKAEYKGTGKALRQFALRRAHRYGEELAEVNGLAPFCIVFKSSACRSIGPLREDMDLSASLHDYFARLRQASRKVAVALDTYVHYEPHDDLPSTSARPSGYQVLPLV